MLLRWKILILCEDGLSALARARKHRGPYLKLRPWLFAHQEQFTNERE